MVTPRSNAGIAPNQKYRLRVIRTRHIFSPDGEVLGQFTSTHFFPTNDLAAAHEFQRVEREGGGWEEVVTRSDYTMVDRNLRYDRGQSVKLAPTGSPARRGILRRPDLPGEMLESQRVDALKTLGYIPADPNDDAEAQGSGQVEPAYVPPKPKRPGIEDEPALPSVTSRRVRRDKGKRRGVSANVELP